MAEELKSRYNSYLQRDLSAEVEEKVRRYVGYTELYLSRLATLSSDCKLLIAPRTDHPDASQQRSGINS